MLLVGQQLLPDTSSDIEGGSTRSSSPDQLVANVSDHLGMIKPPDVCIALLFYT